MNQIPANITQIVKQEGCALIEMSCKFGLLYSLVVDTNDFTLQEKVIATFKENEVFILSETKPVYSLNIFQGTIDTYAHNGIFTRLSLIPKNCKQDDLAHTIHMIIPSLSPLLLNPKKQYIWYVPSTHIIIERHV